MAGCAEFIPRANVIQRWRKHILALLTIGLAGCLDPQALSSYLRISVSPSHAAIRVREIRSLTATVVNHEGRPRTLPIHWWSSNDAVATVEPSGLVRGVGVGVATIHASAEGAEAVATVQVSLIQIQPQNLRLMLGDTVRLIALVADTSGMIVPDPTIRWLSSDSAIASVDAVGLVTGRAIGTASIIAMIDNKEEASAQATVTPWTLVGAGDIGDCTWGGDEATAAVLDSIPGIVFTLGDNAYPNGTAEEFTNCYGPSWGRHKSRTRPSPGNHDYHTPGASAYYAYFGASAGDSSKGYYSFDLGSWHIVAINSTIPIGPGSVQNAWLRDDLASHPAKCTLAYWHYSLFSSGMYSVAVMRTAWQVLYDGGADVVLTGHDHFYERFALQTPDGQPDPTRGIREFVVGTGGSRLQPFVSVAPNSEVRNNRTHGVLRLSLYAESYDWRFLAAAGGTFSDSGTGLCH